MRILICFILILFHSCKIESVVELPQHSYLLELTIHKNYLLVDTKSSGIIQVNDTTVTGKEFYVFKIKRYNNIIYN